MNTGQKTLESMQQAQWYNNYTLGLFSKYLFGDILEVGTGIGNFTESLSKYGTVTSVDIEQNYINLNKKSSSNRNISIGYGDIEKGKYFFSKKVFDSLVCLNVLEHIKDDDKALQNMYKLLKPGGYLILQVPSDMLLYGSIDKSIGHYRRYEKKPLTDKLSREGFKIVSSRKFNFLGGIGWFVAGRILKKEIVEEDKVKVFNLIAPVILPLEQVFEPPIGTSVFIIAQK